MSLFHTLKLVKIYGSIRKIFHMSIAQLKHSINVSTMLSTFVQVTNKRHLQNGDMRRDRSEGDSQVNDKILEKENIKSNFIYP